MKYLTVTVDSNDADYETRRRPLDDVNLSMIKGIMSDLKKNERGAIDWNSYARCVDGLDSPPKIHQEDIVYMEENVFPYGGDWGFHTIVSMKVEEITLVEDLLCTE